MPPIRVLYIDDEEHNLNSFKASFRRQYEIYATTSPTEALNLLGEIDIHVFISDQRMPEITGVELFKLAKAKNPDPVRVLLTGYTDIEALAAAINEGDIYRYITKPWNDLDLSICIKNAYDKYMDKVLLRTKVIELEKTNDELNRFIYSVSHELRAPLASALGILNVARLENLFTKEGGDFWKMMDDCCNKLDHNITNTIQYYKNNRYKSINEVVDFKELVKDLITLHKRANNIDDEIAFLVNIDQEVEFKGDKFRIEIILGNLISNAIKYQKPKQNNKKVEISVKVTILDAIITVSDNGLGILSEHLDKIYIHFFRGRNHADGIGLGLFIVKEALTKIGGIISVQSDENGTAFNLRLPNNA